MKSLSSLLGSLSASELAEATKSMETLLQLASAFREKTPQLAQVLAPRLTNGDDRARSRITEAQYQSLVEQIPAITFMASLAGGSLNFYVSPQIENLLGFTAEEWLDNPFLWFRQLHPEDRGRWNLEFARGCMEGGPFRLEFRALTRDGRTVWVHGEGRVVRDDAGQPLFIQGIAFDITESKRAEEQIRSSLKEKEVLLKEIHHRVKNNLQIISSLLKLQSSYVKDPDAMALFRDSQNRIRSMALVHEKLYQSSDLSRIDFVEYLRTLTSLVLRSYESQASRVRLVLHGGEVMLDIDTAIPCGLLVNELVSNCLKHAFPAQRSGRIEVSIQPVAEEQLELVVRDDGVGIPAGLDVEQTETLGMQLVQTLAGQIGGRVKVESAGGTAFSVRFPRPPTK